MKVSTLAFLSFVTLFIVEVLSDCYLHAPRGSNNRLNEANRNRNNDNRLFNSQNNAAGGYCWGPRMTYYYGSLLQVEWTIQHGCGPDHPNVECELVLQYMCGDYVRDGTTTDTISQATMNLTDSNGNYIYGMHEPFDYYNDCQTRQRNLGLFTADRVSLGDLPPNGGSATQTRQNNGGTQYGFECPEERDYYPYWHPTPWKDIAVITSNPGRCSWYQSESQNVKGKNYCSNPQYNNQADCQSNGYQWLLSPPWNIPPPDCVVADYNRDNHLGNVRGYYLMTNTYDWVVPTLSQPQDGQNCVLRLRYNVSSGDYNGWQQVDDPGAPMIDYRYNDAQSPVQQDPNVQYGSFNYTLAIDTTQFGRTFQDRSHVFVIAPRPPGIPAVGRIFNLGVRGKRGNIVQVYPAVEYDFTPNYLKIGEGDFLHIQWTGCDTNPANNAGEGATGTDRSNIVMINNNDQRRNYPINFAQQSMFPPDVAERLAQIDQPANYCAQATDTGCCRTYAQLQQLYGNNQGAIENDPWNCYKLNAAPTPYFNAGLLRASVTGQWSYMSTRNNNFTNRSQKATLIVQPLIPWWGLAFVITGAAGFVAAAVVAVVVWYSKTHPESAVSNLNWKI
jgi:hypothetical protein